MANPTKGLSDEDVQTVKPTPTAAAPRKGLSDEDVQTVQQTPQEKEQQPRGWLSNEASDDALTGGAKNVVSSVLEAAPGAVFGIPGALADTALGVGAELTNWYERAAQLTGLSEDKPRPRKEIETSWRAGIKAKNQERIDYFKKRLEEPGLSEEGRKQLQRNIDELTELGGLPPTPQQIYEKVRPYLPGHYEPQTAAGRFVNSATKGAVAGAAVPGLGLLAGATAGATAGTASQGLTEAGIESPTAHFATTMVAPWAAGKVAGTARRGVFGLNADERYAAAAKVLAKNTRDAEAALAEVRKRAGMPDETLAEASGDQGHARAQDIMAARGDPTLVTALENLRVARNEQLQHQLRAQGMNARPEDLVKGFEEHQGVLETAADRADAAAGINPASTMDAAGNTLIQGIHGKPGGTATVERARLDALKKMVDPDGTLGTWAGDITAYAKNDLAEATTQPEKARGTVADKMLEQAAGFGDMKSYRALDQFAKSINEKLAEVPPGSTDHNSLLGLKRVVKEAQNKAIENQHKIDQAAVARGELDPNQTLAARLQQSVDNWQKSRAGEGAPIFGQKNMRPVDPATVQTLQEFNADWGKYKDTFKAGPVGEAEPRVGVTPKPSAQVAEGAFKPGTSGFEVANKWIAAGGEGAVATLKEIATNRLQNQLSKGKSVSALDEGALNTWREQHKDAIRAIDDADRAAGRTPFSEQFNDAASARQVVKNFEDSRAGDFLGLKHADDIVKTVGEKMKASDGALQMAELMKQAEATPGGSATVEGLRRAAARFVEEDIKQRGQQYLNPQGENVPVLGGPKIKEYMDKHEGVLTEVFGPEAVANIKKLIEVNDRSVAVRTRGLATHGAQTAERVAGEATLNAAMDAALGLDAKSGNLTTGGFLTSQLYFEAGKALLKGEVWDATKHAGLALLNSTVGQIFARRGLRGKIDVSNLLGKALADRNLGEAMLQRIVDEQGRPNQIAIDALAKAIIASETESERRNRLPKTYARVGRARGGRTTFKLDCASKASKLCREAELIRKRHAGQTKEYLNVPDDVVASALRVAGGRLH